MMKILLSWLEQYIEDTPNWDYIFDKLTDAGVEVENVSMVAPYFTDVVIGEVITKNKHPNADKLNICQVIVDNNQKLEIVCGASNVEVGVKVPCAKLGAKLPNNFTIIERQMRGVTSYGMLCSGDELGIKSDIDGLLILDKNAPVGLNIREYLNLDDKVVEFKITPNRADCLSVRGILREISLLTGGKLRNLGGYELLNITDELEQNGYINSRYIMQISNIDNSIILPSFIIDRIIASGINTVNPLMDILNYIMLETGQPLFAYRCDNGKSITTQFSQDKITNVVINAKGIQLDNFTLVNIIDKNIVGITGVATTDLFLVDFDTKNVIIDAISIIPDYVIGASKKYNINSNSAYRYERGVDYSIGLDAISYAYSILKYYMPNIIITNSSCTKKQDKSNGFSIKLFYQNISRVIGIELNHDNINRILLNVGCNICNKTNEYLEVFTPSYRFDLSLEIDLIEEIARVYGYDKIIANNNQVEYNLKYLDNNFKKMVDLKHKMALYGYYESINYAFIEDKYNDINYSLYQIESIRLQNAIAGLYNMRTSLIGGLIKSMQHNINRGHQSIKLFELAKVFHSEEESGQVHKIAGICYGLKYLVDWHNNKSKVEFDFYDIKADVENILLFLSDDLVFEPINDINLLHPGRCAKIYHKNKQIGVIGQLHPIYLQILGLEKLPYVFELDLDYILLQKKILNIKPPLKFQKVERDMAVVLDSGINGYNLIDFIYKLNVANLIYCNIFDIYTGDNVEAGKKSIAINLIFQANKTLVEDEINNDFNFIINQVLQHFNAKLR